MIIAYLALGSNLQDPIRQIRTAFHEIASLPQTTLLKTSSLYQNPPVGKLDQPDFINAVVKVSTYLSAEQLLEELLSIENTHQRVRLEKNGPRTLDLDILLYGDHIIANPSLQIPHPRLKERAFVILPLAEIDSHLQLPCHTTIESLLAALPGQQLKRIVNDELQELY